MKYKNGKKSQLRLILLACFLSFLITIVLVCLVPSIKVVLENWHELQNSNSSTLNESDKFNASLEIVKTIVSGISTVATVAGGLVLYLNFRVANRNTEIAHRNAEIAHRNAKIADERLITERFSKAIEQLGSEKLEVCLGGIYSLEKIANNSSEYHWTIMEVLTTFIREMSWIDVDKGSARNSLTYKTAIQTAITVIGRRKVTEDPLERVLDLSSANLNNFTVSGNFGKAIFRGAKLNSADLQGTIFEYADFSDSNLAGAKLNKAILRYAIFTDANLNFTNIVDANLEFAKLNGAFLYKADFRNANLQGVDLSNAHIKGALFVKANLTNSNLTNTVFWDSDNWEHRHWTVEQYWIYESCLEEERQAQASDYNDSYDEEPSWKPDFRLASGLEDNLEKIQVAKDYANAIYDESLRQLLGLPEYKPQEVRNLETLLEF